MTFDKFVWTNGNTYSRGNNQSQKTYQMLQELVKGMVFVRQDENWSGATALQQGVDQFDRDEGFASSWKFSIEDEGKINTKIPLFWYYKY